MLRALLQEIRSCVYSAACTLFVRATHQVVSCLASTHLTADGEPKVTMSAARACCSSCWSTLVTPTWPQSSRYSTCSGEQNIYDGTIYHSMSRGSNLASNYRTSTVEVLAQRCKSNKSSATPSATCVLACSTGVHSSAWLTHLPGWAKHRLGLPRLKFLWHAAQPALRWYSQHCWFTCPTLNEQCS